MNEFELIANLTKNLPRKLPGLIQGVGDDSAVIESKDKWWLLTTDILTENIHFDTNTISPFELGEKAIAVNLSDIAAMGGTPKYFLVSVSVPEKLLSIADELFKGLEHTAKEYDTILIGGDTTKSLKDLFISITAIGETKPNKCIFRNGAKPGDLVFITGFPGSSALGFELIKNNISSNDAANFIQKFKSPIPRIQIGNELAENGFATSMIDSSDGLLADLSHIAEESKVGFKIDFDQIPTLNNFVNLASNIDKNPQNLILAGGEDYELIFTANPKNEDFIKKLQSSSCPITKIGLIVQDKNMKSVLNNDGEEIEPPSGGFDHFQNPNVNPKKHPWVKL